MAKTVSPPSPARSLPDIALTALAFFAVSWLLLYFIGISDHSTNANWHGFGLALACLLICGIRLWPGIAIGSFLAGLAAGLTISASASLALGNALGAFAATSLLQRRNFDSNLGQLRDYFLLMSIGTILAPGISACAGVLLPIAFAIPPEQGVFRPWLQWWIADSVGALTIVPLLLLWIRRKAVLPQRRFLEFLALTALTVLVAIVVFIGWEQEIFGDYVHGYMVLPLVVWGAISYGRRITTLGSVIIFVMSMLSIRHNIGLFSHAGRQDIASMVNLWLFVTICSVVGMTLSIVFYELRKTQRAMRENEANFRSLAESSLALIWLSDMTGRHVWFNRAWLDFTGRTLNEEKFDGWREGLHEDDAERCLTIYREAFATRRPFEMEYRLRHHTGRYRTLLDHGAPRFDDQGNFLGFTGSCWDITARREAEQALLDRERMLRAIYDNSGVAIGFLSPDGKISHANRRLADMFGFTLDEIIGTAYADHVHPAENLAGLKINALMEGKLDLVEIDRRYLRKDGSEFWGHLASRQMRDEHGNILGLVGVITDITERKAADAQLRLAAQVFDNNHEAIMIVDAQKIIASINPAFTKITGYDADEAVGKTPELLRSGKHGENFYADLAQQLERTGHWDGEASCRCKDGRILPIWQSISVVRNERGMADNYICIFADITERKAAEDRIRHLAQYDFLTDLPNRALLFDRLTREFFEARRYDKRFAVLFIDLDNFKPVNDRYGHAAGDLLLREVARRLRENVRDSDTVSRQGGDEFIILVPELPETEQIVQLGIKLLHILDEPYRIDGHNLCVTPSIGIAVYPEDGEDIDTLMKNADTAMYRAKNAGRNNLQCYGAELNALARNSLF